MTRRAWLESGLIFLATAAALTVLAQRHGDLLLDALLPLYRLVLEWLLPACRLDYLDLRELHGETVVAMTVTQVDYRMVLGVLLPAGLGIDASTLAGHALVHPILVLSLVAAWPARDGWERGGRLGLALPVLLGLELLDIPLMLWGATEDLVYWRIDPARVAESLGSRVQHFLDGGGRYALALAGALGAVVLGDAVRNLGNARGPGGR